jgi:hypothetical protein
MMKKVIVLMGLAAVVMLVTEAEAFRITTSDPGGADAELRESQPTTNRGASSEIASRQGPAYGKQSEIYLKFGVGDLTPADLAGDITVRTTYRNTNLTPGRFQDIAGGGPNTGWDYYAVIPTETGANWDETTIAPTTDTVAGTVQPPGYFYDGNIATKGCGTPGFPTTGLVYLGSQLYQDADMRAGHMPVGGAFDFTMGSGSVLHALIDAAQATPHQTLSIVMCVIHDTTNPNINWLDFNYLFNPKEMTVLNEDVYSPWGGLAESYYNSLGGSFNPQLTNEPHITPEPATIALLGLGGLLLRRKR